MEAHSKFWVLTKEVVKMHEINDMGMNGMWKKKRINDDKIWIQEILEPKYPQIFEFPAKYYLQNNFIKSKEFNNKICQICFSE